jgi:hypothetical protein
MMLLYIKREEEEGLFVEEWVALVCLGRKKTAIPVWEDPPEFSTYQLVIYV